jgi:hypothetical protein
MVGRVWRPAGRSGIGVALVVLVAAFLFAATTARAAAPPPPDLVALEQQMAQLHVNTERVSFQEELSFGELGSGIPFALIVTGEGEFSDSPPQGSAVAGILGLSNVQTRVIGDTVYTYRPHAGELDGGRPWVRSQKSGGASPSIDPSGVTGSDQPGPQGTFSKLIEELGGALAIEESGPVTVEDQRVIEFDATLDPTPFLEKLKPQSKEPKHPLNSLLETPETKKTPAKSTPPPSLELEVFIAPNGLPVRARYTFSAEGVTISARVDTLATNIPVNVSAPPASQTIDEAQLKRLERRRAARELRRALRACRHEHGKQAMFCRQSARIKSLTPRAELSLL